MWSSSDNRIDGQQSHRPHSASPGKGDNHHFVLKLLCSVLQEPVLPGKVSGPGIAVRCVRRVRRCTLCPLPYILDSCRSRLRMLISKQCKTNLQPGTSFGLVMPCSSSIRFAGTACPPAKIGLRSPPFRSLVAVEIPAGAQHPRRAKSIDPRCMFLEELPPEASSQKVSQWKGKQDCNLAKAADTGDFGAAV